MGARASVAERMNLLHANDRAGEYPPSYYAATAKGAVAYPTLQGEIQADVCIIGGGYMGLSAALHLAEKGVNVVVLEAQLVGFGASGRNGGQVGSGQRQDQDWLRSHYGDDAARRMWGLAEDAKALVKSLIARHQMPVTWADGVATVSRSLSGHSANEAYALSLARDYGYDRFEVMDRAETAATLGSNAYQGAVIDLGAGHIHPLNYALGLATAASQAGARIFTQSEVHHITEGSKPVVQTAQGRVICNQVILAANGYLGGLNRHMAARVMPINNFILATEPLTGLLKRNIAVADDRFVVNYWRMSEDGRLLFGGGESYGYKFPQIIPTVMKPLLRVYPQLKDVAIDYAWGGTLAITMNRMPYFSKLAGNIWAASACSGHGVALSTLAGRIMAEAVTGPSPDFDLMAQAAPPPFPGGVGFRTSLLALAMTWYALRDRLGL